MKRLTRSALCRFSVGVVGVFLAGFVAIGTAWAQAGQPASASQTPTVVKEGLRLNQQELAEAQQRVAPESGGVAKSTTITRTPVYRFYNTTTTAHFYTASVSERNTVQATMPHMVYEGAAFDVSSSNSAGLSPVYRFYNQSNGVHFYTISEAEKNHLLANAPSMRLDGAAYYASQVAGPAFRPLYRFYVPSRGFHFYTVSDNEKNSLIASNPNYLFEGVAYYVLGSPQPPSVGLTAPAAGATFTAPASITLTANADDLDGWVTSVAFYSGTALLGTDTTAPYSSNWNNVPAGTYSITARATDNSGVVTTSAAVTVTVMVNAPANQPPSVSLSAPGAGASFTAPATVGISANAADSDGSIASVAFYSGSTLLGTDTSAPYSYSWNNVAAGSYSVTARATDNNGAVTTSAAVSFTVGAANSPPIIEWYIPTDGALIGDSPLHMEVGASDPDGSIVRVEFYDNGTLLGTVENPPYFYGTGGALSAGQHTLYAIAYDNQGASTTSAAVSVTGAGSNSPPMVNLISPLEGAVYLTSSTVQLEANASDTDGGISLVEFYEGANLLGSDNTEPFSFDWVSPTQGTKQLWARAVDDQGVGTNSSFVFVTVNPASGTTPSIRISAPLSVPFAPSPLLDSSGNVVDLSGIPSIRYSAAPATVPLEVDVSFAEGSIDRVEYFSGNTLVGTNNVPPYNFHWTGVPSGDHLIKARVIASNGLSSDSEPLFVTVDGGGDQCEVWIDSPRANRVYRRTAGNAVSVLVEVAGEPCVGPVDEVKVLAWIATNDLDFPSWGSWFSDTSTGPLPKTFTVTFPRWGSYSASIAGYVKTPDGAIRMTSMVGGLTFVDPSISLQVSEPSGGGSTYPVGSSVDMTASVVDCTDCTTRVDFYDGATLLGSDTQAPYTFTLSNLQEGTHILSARAVDFEGQEMTSSVTVTVEANRPPAVTMTGPATGSTHNAPATLELSATATDPDGDNTIASVSFYNGNTLIGSDNLSPYSFSWTNVPAGTYSLTALATDSSGLSTTSEPLSVTVQAASGETVTYIHTDISGSPLAATNASGNLVWKENYSAYGVRNLAQPGSEGQKQWFHGKEVDASTGLQYFGARYYDPAIGRFMGVDPVGFQEDNLHSFNRYAYGNNNPVRYLDPDGNSPLDVGFLLWDVGKLGLALYSGNGAMIGEAAADVFISTVGVLSPVPGTGLAIKAGRAADKASDVVRAAKGISGETKFTSAGRRAHAQEPLPPGFEREVTIPGTKLRMDGYNRKTKQILEIKPDNARAVKRGESQLEKYCAACDKSELGSGHSTVPVQTYDPSKYVR